VVFAERDHSSGLQVLEQFGRSELSNNEEYRQALSRIRHSLDYDTLLAEKFKGRPVVLGYYFTDMDDRQKRHVSGLLPAPVFTKESLKGITNDFIRMNGYGANIPELQQVAMSAGHFNPAPDVDGVSRRVPMLIEYQGAYYESLSTAMVRGVLGNPDLKPGHLEGTEAGIGYNRVDWLTISDLKIPVDDQVTALIPYRGKQGSFLYLSASDVIHGRVKADQLEGAIVLVGTTAPGLMDLRSTPVSAVYAGVEIHANMIAGILDQTIMRTPAYVQQGVEIVMLLISGVLLSLLLPRLGPINSIIVTAVLLAASIGINLAAWHRHLVLPLASSLLLIPVLYVYNMTYGFLIEARAKRQITGLFGQYVPPALVDVMSKNPEKFTMEADSREMTVLFSDVRNFTTISESLEPKELSLMMNDYMTRMTGVIHRESGTIDKYIGDAIMAFWGAPLPNEDHARHAVRAALEMQRIMVEVRRDFAARGWPELHIGVGLNTGVMRVGNMGSEFRMAYTVMGDAVNLGSRLESITKQYGVGIIVGENTTRSLPDYLFRELDLVQVKGKNEPVAIHEPIGLKNDLDKTVLDNVYSFDKAVELYRQKMWDEAAAILAGLASDFPDVMLYKIYQDRIARFREDPPPEDWDGVYIFSTK
jgi:adenylate cyclase